MEKITLAEFMEIFRQAKHSTDDLRPFRARFTTAEHTSETLRLARKLALESKGPSKIVYCLRGCQGRAQRKTINSINLSDVTLLFFPLGSDPFNINDSGIPDSPALPTIHVNLRKRVRPHGEDFSIGGQILSVSVHPATRLARQGNGRGRASREAMATE